MISAIELALSLLSGVLTEAKVGGLPANIIAEIEAAVAAVAKVQGTPVTFGQLETLRIKTQW